MTFRDQLIAQRVQEGASVRDVAREFGTTPGAVTLVVLKSGGSFPEAAGRNKKIVELARAGVPQARIAQDLDVSLRTVEKEVRQARRNGALS